MHTRFGATPYELDSYFDLYLDYIDLDNANKAEEYKNKLTRKYPDSKYTAILTDPEFFNKANSKNNKSEQYYQAVYALFEKGDYEKALDAIKSQAHHSEMKILTVPKWVCSKRCAWAKKKAKMHIYLHSMR